MNNKYINIIKYSQRYQIIRSILSKYRPDDKNNKYTKQNLLDMWEGIKYKNFKNKDKYDGLINYIFENIENIDKIIGNYLTYKEHKFILINTLRCMVGEMLYIKNDKSVLSYNKFKEIKDFYHMIINSYIYSETDKLQDLPENMKKIELKEIIKLDKHFNGILTKIAKLFYRDHIASWYRKIYLYFQDKYRNLQKMV